MGFDFMEVRKVYTPRVYSPDIIELIPCTERILKKFILGIFSLCFFVFCLCFFVHQKIGQLEHSLKFVTDHDFIDNQ